MSNPLILSARLTLLNLLSARAETLSQDASLVTHAASAQSAHTISICRGNAPATVPATLRIREEGWIARCEIPESHAVIYGSSEIGDKARELIAKAPQLQRLGANIVPSVVLAEDVFSDFFQRNGLGHSLREVRSGEETMKRIMQGKFDRHEVRIFEQALSQFEGKPLMVRSSAKGDARGTGAYESWCCRGDLKSLILALRRVLASYFSPKAIAFRRDANKEAGFGVIIQPIVGEVSKRKSHYIAPTLSGFGYTSTAHGEGYLSMVPGLGGGVQSQGTERISSTDLRGEEDTLYEYLYRALRAYLYNKRRESSLLHVDTERWLVHAFDLQGPAKLGIRQVMWEEDNDFVDTYYADAKYDCVNLSSLFELMRQIEGAFGVPQYFEWAITVENSRPQFWITQIADVHPVRDEIDFGNPHGLLIETAGVVGTGTRTCTGIVVCRCPHDQRHGRDVEARLKALDRFNATHSNYVVLYSASLHTGVSNYIIPYTSIDRASALIEVQNCSRGEQPIAHWCGMLEETNKFFATLHEREEEQLLQALKAAGAQDQDGLLVLLGDVTVFSSAARDRLQIRLGRGSQA